MVQKQEAWYWQLTQSLLKIDLRRYLVSDRVVYTAFNNATAKMMVENLTKAGIPVRVGTDSAWTGVGAIEQSRTVIVPEEYEKEAKEIIREFE